MPKKDFLLDLSIITLLIFLSLKFNVFSAQKVIAQETPSKLPMFIEKFQKEFETRYISSSAMLPTLANNDTVIVDKYTYLTEHPQRGDIIIFNAPEQLKESYDGVWIKRVIGLPEETIEIKSGKKYRIGLIIVQIPPKVAIAVPFSLPFAFPVN